MKRIEAIEEDLKLLQPKLDILAKDWTAEEKQAIENAYFAITKVSVGFGRTVDLGCDSCVQSAVNIINNYLGLVKASEAGTQTAQHGSQATSTIDWRDTHALIDREASHLKFTFPPEAKTKKEKIKLLEAHMESLQSASQESNVENDAQEYTKEQLAEIIKAQTGEEINPEDFTYEQLLETVTEINNEADEESE